MALSPVKFNPPVSFQLKENTKSPVEPSEKTPGSKQVQLCGVLIFFQGNIEISAHMIIYNIN